ncbi:MAG: hypothetical protein JWQ36_1780 [Enterovirga sp.]|nr:hypothetical protein [Enterovirga sp.]
MAITLSNGVRQNLLSLQSTATLVQQTQLRLGTGKKVNSAIDNTVNYFTSATLHGRADQLSSLLDGMSNGVQTITAASNGIDAILKLVQSSQSTIKQALQEAAQNRPSRTGTTALANAAEAGATGKGLQDITLDKKLEEASAGAGAAAATATSSGNLGMATGSTVTITAGPTTYSFDTTPGMTVRDLVNNINSSGIATASVDTAGKFTITGSGSNPLKFNIADSAAGDGLDNLGFAAGDVTTLTGTGATVATTSTVRANLVAQFNDLREQIDKLATDGGFNGVNLLAGDRLQIVFNEKGGAQRSTMQVQGNKLTALSIGIMPAGNVTLDGQINFQNDVDLNAANEALTTAMTSLRSVASNLGSQLAVVQSRQEFTKNIVNTLKTGADNLVLADTNEEGANLLALQTRQQLSQTSLSLAAQADQSVLKLFG